ncbi:hypothetical protein FRC02_002658 [Tulasnella sp. 418]|nr:hypothetical protein FRC02_002658 [Tulasnella sp. 418]
MTHSPHHTELDLTSNYYTLNAGAIAAKFPLRYNTPEKRKRLRNTVRHHLSLYPKFFLDGKPEGASGKAQFWAIDPLALNEPPRSNPEKERSKMSTSTTSRSTGPTRISGRKRMDQGPTSNPGRSSRQQRMNPSLSLQPPSSPEETPGSSVPHSELSLEPSTFFPVSPQHAHFAVSPTATQSHPVTPLFPSELSPSPFHPDITVYSDMAEDYNNQLSPGSSVGFPISPQLAHFMAVEPTIVQGFPNTPLLPSDPLFPVSQAIVSANLSSGYPASNVMVHYNIQQVMPSTFQSHIPQVHAAYPFQPFGIPPLPSTLDNDSPTSTTPFASTCSSYVDLDQGLQESSSSLLGYGFGSMMNTPLDFSFAQPEHGGISVSDWLSLSEMSSVENPQ